MQAGDTLQITEQPWYEPEDATPTLAGDETETALAFNLVPAQGQGPTVALLAAYRMSGRYADVYGSRIPGAVYVVAVDTANGHIYYNHAEPSHVVPLTAAMDAGSSAGDSTLVSIEGHFNVDLAQQLGLPPQEATYAVFLWLDDMVTEVKTVTLPSDPERPGQPPVSNSSHKPYAVVFDDGLDIRPPRSDAIALEQVSGDGPAVVGRLGSDLLEPRRAEQQESSLFVGILGLCQRTRQVVTWTRVVPEEMNASDQVSFRISVSRFIECDEPNSPIHLLAYAGGTHSSVVTVEHP